MFHPQVSSDIPDLPYGYGLDVGQQNGHRYVGHPGGFGGYGSYLAYFPDSGLTVIVLSNNGYFVELDDMAKIAFGEK
jgi:CubicO group peptidase (beta-lactamase class C family)